MPLLGPRGEPLRAKQLDLLLPTGGSPVHLLIAGPQREIEIEVAAFNRLLVIALGSLGLLLIAAFAVQIRWGLAPLRRLGDQLKRVRSGDQPTLGTSLPRELPGDLAEVATAINEVLAHQQALIERARSATGNLAHALKQPLAALHLQLDGEKLDRSAVRESLARIGETVDHHLSRAAAAGRVSGLYGRASLRDSLLPIVEAVRSIHVARGLTIVAELPAGRSVRIDVQDLQELAGNLLDNAALAARSEVRLSVIDEADGLLMLIDDDGPGIPDAAHALVIERGVRLDEQRPGSGLGLSIVRDLAELHGLALSLSASPLGGLRVGLRFSAGARATQG
nr:HAMP domain-containing sensor histidine kinase [Nevskia ramosa]